MAERRAQKQRTRGALLAATRALLARGEAVTVQAAAEEANISKATAYRYFSDAAVMTAEAALDFEVPDTADLLRGIEDPRERVHKVAAFHLDFPRRNEVAFRGFLIKAFETWLNSPPGARPAIRGARRIPAFREALRPLEGRLDDAAMEDLVTALCCATGIELHVTLADVCGLDPASADRIARIMVDAVLDRFGVGAS